MLELIWHRRTADIPDAVWADCFPPPHEGLFWFRALEAAGIADQFTFFFGLLRDAGAPVGIVPAFVFDLPLELVLPDAASRRLAGGAFASPTARPHSDVFHRQRCRRGGAYWPEPGLP